MQIDEIIRLIKYVRQYDIYELEVSNENWKVRITRQTSAAAVSPQSAVEPAVTPLHAAFNSSPAAKAPAIETETGASSPDNRYVEIASPMVGTFYRAAAPDADPYVQVNDIVAPGQTVCIIEAMKLMNEIPSEVKGRVVQILVENAQPVEYGQPLFLVEPL